MTNWLIFRGNSDPHDEIKSLPDPPPWRQFARGEDKKPKINRGATFQAESNEIQLVNAALYLRRPLLITGRPGTGKTSLAYAVAHELKLGEVLRWSITSRSTLAEGLYQYDAIGRMQEAALHPGVAADISKFLRLGPLGTALLPSPRPRCLLIDELDKSDIDLPNDLLNIFEEGEYEIPELVRLEELIAKIREHESANLAAIKHGRVQCKSFPFVVITSNGEREFAPAFLRRCLRLDIPPPDKAKLERIVEAHLGPKMRDQAETLIREFLSKRDRNDIATDQLLQAIYLVVQQEAGVDGDKDGLISALLRPLGSSEMT